MRRRSMEVCKVRAVLGRSGWSSNKSKMSRRLAILVCLLLMAAAGCSPVHNVNTAATREFVKELEAFTPAVENVRFTFQRPDLYCRIDMSREPSEEELEGILARIGEFATVENMNEIARSVRWGLEISNIYLDINTDRDRQTVEHAYYARYFKTFDASDRSEANIEAYSVWYERELPRN